MGPKNRLKPRHKYTKPQPKKQDKLLIYYKLEVELRPVSRSNGQRWDVYLHNPFGQPIHLGGLEKVQKEGFRFWPLGQPGTYDNKKTMTRNDALVKLFYTYLEM